MWHSTSPTGSVRGPGVSGCWCMAHRGRAVTGSGGRDARGRGVSRRPTQPSALLKGEAVFCGSLREHWAQVKSKNQSPSLLPQKVHVRKQRGRSGFPRGTPPAVHFCLHVIQDVGQGVLYHSAPAHVTHGAASEVFGRILEARPEVNGDRAALVQ